MTASAMIIGMVPMSMGNSPNAPLGRAVIGGLLVATLFTLFFVPCVYAMIYNRRTARQKEQCIMAKILRGRARGHLSDPLVCALCRLSDL